MTYFNMSSNPPRAIFSDGDTDEMSGTLDELKAWVESMIATHGGDAMLGLDADDADGDEVRVNYRISRAATPEEISAERARIEANVAKDKARRRADFERLKAEFGQDEADKPAGS